MELTQFCVILIIIPVTVFCQTQLSVVDPCIAFERSLPQGSCAPRVCRLVEVNCVRAPCPPLPQCVNEPEERGYCEIGNPVLNMTRSPKYCDSNFPCPDNTTCFSGIQGIASSCCWNGNGYDPCIATSCPAGTICKARPTNNCLLPPCNDIGVCLEPSCPKPCTDTTECRLRELTCDSPPCPAIPTCVPRTTPSSSPRCPVGRPALNASNFEFFCGRGPSRQSCPTNTYCNVHPTDLWAVCCHAAPVTTTQAPSGCAVTTCGPGFRCEEFETPCAAPGPCPIVAVCIRDAPKPGQCPAMFGGGTCVTTCETDSSCNGTMKCCYNGCGYVCMNPVGITTTTSAPNECASVTCPTGTVCRVAQPLCFPGGPCPPPRGECVSVVSTSTTPAPPSPCEEARCPPGTVCRVSQVTCRPGSQCPPPRSECHPVTPKPGQCPAVSGFGICITTCETDSDCNGTSKCCSNGCGQVCRDPVGITTTTSAPNTCASVRCPSGTECRVSQPTCRPGTPCPPARVECVSVTPKPGQCPAVSGAGICITTCETDNNCTGTLKCCYNGCGYVCMNPVGITTTTSAPNECASVRCPSGTECRVSRPTCRPGSPCPPARVECVSTGVSTTTSAPTPCTGVRCGSGMECRVLIVDCFGPPCPPPRGECVPVVTTPAPSPCAYTKCGAGQVCTEIRPRCPPVSGECSLQAQCVPLDYPCTRMLCAPGLTCVERESNCRYPPCQREGNCVPVTTPAPSPCAYTKCGAGEVCTEIRPRCPPVPGECPLRAQCVPLDYPCRRMFCAPGLTCVERETKCRYPPCQREGNCVPRPTQIPPYKDPCNGRCTRRRGFECRIKKFICFSPRCRLRAVCVRSRSIGGSRRLSCPAGRPVINQINQPMYCIRDSTCPTGTYCYKDAYFKLARCCPGKRPFVPTTTPAPLVKDGRCPSTDGSFGICVNLCKYDNSCPGSQKCCSNGCGRTCQNPVPIRPFEKEGVCPSTIGRVGTCVERCFNDSSCPGTLKCCSNGCGHTCQEPSIYAPSDPCYNMTCGYNEVCRLIQVNCFAAPCPPSTTCVAKSTLDSTRRCTSGYPVMGMTCRYGCPDFTRCSNNGCCWDKSAYSTTTATTTAMPTTTQRDGRCPSTAGLSWLYCSIFYNSCNFSSCSWPRICCYAGSCGKKCMMPRY